MIDKGPNETTSAETLELREARYRTLFEASKSVLWAADPAGRFPAGQREWERFTGVPEDAQLGFGWMDAIHSEDRGRFVREWAEARACTEVFVSEVRIWNQEHEEFRECELRSAPLMADESQVREWVGHLVDVSELRRAQAAVRERDDTLAVLVENAPVPIFVKDSGGRYVLASRHVREMLASTPGDSVVGRTDDELMAGPVAERVRANDQEVLRSGEVRVFEEMIPAEGDRDRWWLTTKFPLPSAMADGKHSLAGIAVDVTERHRLAEERAEAIRRRDDFLAMLSHELRNPMQAILHAVQLVDAEDADRSREAKAIVRRQVHHVSRMLADLLDVSRMVHGRIDLAMGPVSLERVVDAATETVAPVLAAAGVELRVDGRSGHVRGDETRLVQVVVNLLRNAVTHTGRGDVIVLALRTEDDTLALEVSDSGVGIAPRDLERIFDPFFQREQSIARSRGGLGLGLSLARTLAELHGGTLHAESEGVGKGSRFVLQLPRLVKPKEPRAAARTTAKPGPLSFVVVEDNADSRQMLTLWLRSRGHRVMSCADGESGLEAILEEKPDIAVVDIGLPGLDGYAVARAVREQWRGPPLRLVAVTGYGQEEDRRRVVEAGFDDHLIKPVDVEVLERLFAEEDEG